MEINRFLLWDRTDKEGEATSWPNEKHVFFLMKTCQSYAPKVPFKLTEHVAFLARRNEHFLGIDHIRLVHPHKIIEWDIFVFRAVLSISLGIDSFQKCLWILGKKFKFQTTKKINYKHFQCLKQSLKVLLEIKFPMLISVENKLATYHHVVVVWRQSDGNWLWIFVYISLNWGYIEANLQC